MIDRHEIYYAMKILRDQLGQWVYPIHRLDKPTSGVLLFALDKQSARIMSEQFKDRKTKKKYLAVVRGYTDDEGVINHALKDKLDKIADKNASKESEPKEAISEYKTLARVELPYAVGSYDTTRYSLVDILLKTGRKHQIRRHMKHISHHLLGDTKYGRGEHNKFIRSQFNCHRMLLHSYSLEILHPYQKEFMTFRAPLDDTFKCIFESFSWEVKF
jgi:tRNA pseudouridine65 synthase